MSYTSTPSNKMALLLLLAMLLCLQSLRSQEEQSSGLNSNSTYHNQLFFNRFLINPTFSLVRENKSYLNILHRNQYATFEDNSQNYFLGFSNKLNERTALGIGVYSQWAGVVQEFGFNANYATSVQLGTNSKLTFGTNITYFNVGLDKNRAITSEDDPEILKAKKESKLAIQPGVTLSLGKFDIGLYAEDLFKYNQTTNDFTTGLNTTNIKASLQYTHSFMTNRGLFANARLMPLLQIGKNEDQSVSYVGSVLLDLPKYGWLTTTIDDEYGLSMGVGFNLSEKMSLGYLLEKDLSQNEANLGWNHEVSLAYTFKDSNNDYLFADASNDQKVDNIIRNYEEQILQLIAERDNATAANVSKNGNTMEETDLSDVAGTTNNPQMRHATDPRFNELPSFKNNLMGTASIDNDIELPTPKKKETKRYVRKRRKEKNTDTDFNSLAYQNSLILDELILRQDSLEAARKKEFERRFEMIVRSVRNDVRQAIEEGLKDIKPSKHTMLASNESKTSKKMENKIETVASTPLKKYEKLPIKVLDQADIIGVKSGYYVIANVYKTRKYLDAFMKDLKSQGLNAKKFYNKDNGLYYVYLADYNYKADAETAFVSNLDGTYQDEKWIMQVDNSTATAVNMYEE